MQVRLNQTLQASTRCRDCNAPASVTLDEIPGDFVQLDGNRTWPLRSLVGQTHDLFVALHLTSADDGPLTWVCCGPARKQNEQRHTPCEAVGRRVVLAVVTQCSSRKPFVPAMLVTVVSCAAPARGARARLMSARQASVAVAIQQNVVRLDVEVKNHRLVRRFVRGV